MKDSWKEQVYRIVINEKAKIVASISFMILFFSVLIQYINNIFKEGRSFIPVPVIMIYTYFEIGSNFKMFTIQIMLKNVKNKLYPGHILHSIFLHDLILYSFLFFFLTRSVYSYILHILFISRNAC